MSQGMDRKDYTLEGYSRLVDDLSDYSTSKLFLEPVNTLHNIYLSRSRRVDPNEASNRLIDALEARQITAIDLAETIVASRPEFITQFKGLLERRSQLSNSSRFCSAVENCIRGIDEMMHQNMSGQFPDDLYWKSLESLIAYSGVLGKAGEVGVLNGGYYGSYCRRYDQLQVSVSEKGICLSGFSTEQHQLEMIYDLMAQLHEKGIVTEKIAMSRSEFASMFQLSGGEIARRGAHFVVSSTMGILGISTSDGGNLDIHPNTSTPLILERIIQLSAILNQKDVSSVIERFQDQLGDTSGGLKETIERLIPKEMSPEEEQDYRWLLSELHHSLYLQYRARFHNEDKQLISDSGSIHFSVRVDQHREDYGDINIDRQVIAPDAYAKIYREFCSGHHAPGLTQEG